MGYRVCRALMQAGQSLGPRNVGPDFKSAPLAFGDKITPSYRNRALQTSIT